MPAQNVLRLQYQGLIPLPKSTENNLWCTLVTCHVRWITWNSRVMETLTQNLRGTCSFVNKTQWDFQSGVNEVWRSRGWRGKLPWARLCVHPTGAFSWPGAEVLQGGLKRRGWRWLSVPWGPVTPAPGQPTPGWQQASPLPLLLPAGFALQSTTEKRPWTLPFSFLLPHLLATHAAQTWRCGRWLGIFCEGKSSWEDRRPCTCSYSKKFQFAASEPSSCLSQPKYLLGPPAQETPRTRFHVPAPLHELTKAPLLLLPSQTMANIRSAEHRAVSCWAMSRGTLSLLTSGYFQPSVWTQHFRTCSLPFCFL